MARLERHRTDDVDLEAIQDNIADALQPLLNNPLINGGVLLAPVALTTATSEVAHGLGRTLRGWVVVDKDANARIWRVASPANPNSARTIRLTASSAVNVTLYVF